MKEEKGTNKYRINGQAVMVIIPEYIEPLNRFLGATIPENESQSKFQ